MKKGYIQINEEGNYYCPECNSYKPKSSFCTQIRNKHRDGLRQLCNSCRPTSDSKAKIRCINIIHQLRGILRGSKFRIKNNLTIDNLMNLYNRQRGICAISGLPMTSINGRGIIETNVSIDRIDSDKGYELDNVQLVRCRVNKMKSDMSIEELLYYCNNIINNHG